jgi:hypothetical protein
MTERSRPRLPYLSVIAVWALPGVLAVFIGRVTWELSWADTWDFAGIAVFTMAFLGTLGASTQAHFLGTDLRGGQSAGSRLLDEQPFVFGAPWVLVSVLAAALVVEITILD